MQKYYEICISKNTGKITINAEGFTGKECYTKIEELIKALGAVEMMRSKPEYDAEMQTEIQTII